MTISRQRKLNRLGCLIACTAKETYFKSHKSYQEKGKRRSTRISQTYLDLSKIFFKATQRLNKKFKSEK